MGSAGGVQAGTLAPSCAPSLTLRSEEKVYKKFKEEICKPPISFLFSYKNFLLTRYCMFMCITYNLLK